MLSHAVTMVLTSQCPQHLFIFYDRPHGLQCLGNPRETSAASNCARYFLLLK